MIDDPANVANINSRSITDADAEAIAARLEQRLTQKFYRDLGKGVWGIIWKALVVAALFVAGYGASKGMPQ